MLSSGAHLLTNLLNYQQNLLKGLILLVRKRKESKFVTVINTGYLV